MLFAFILVAIGIFYLGYLSGKDHEREKHDAAQRETKGR
jgi:hypothetical protein